MTDFIHTQASASTVWNISHNLGSAHVAIDVFKNNVDDTMSKILPLKIQITGENSLIVNFSVPIAGQARIVKGQGGVSTPLTSGTVLYNIWNELDRKYTVILTNSGRTATVNATGWGGVRGLSIKDYGKFYWEITPNGASTGGFWMGLADVLWSYTQEMGHSSGLNMGYSPNTDFAGTARYGYFDATLNDVTTPDNPASGTYMFAADIGPGKFWIGRNGTWFTGNPGTGTDPTFNFMPGSMVTPAVSLYNATNIITLSTDPANLVHAIPSGFTTWTR